MDPVHVLCETYYPPPDDEALPLLREKMLPNLDGQNHTNPDIFDENTSSSWFWSKRLRSLCRVNSVGDCEGWGIFWQLWRTPPWHVYKTMERFVVHLFLVTFMFYVTSKIIKTREDVYHETTTEAFYFGNKAFNFEKFTEWGISGASVLHWGGNLTGLISNEHLNSPPDEGWSQMCTAAEMSLIISGGEDVTLCSKAVAVKRVGGCSEGYYQPFGNPNLPAKACPEGYFCPPKVACAVQCIPGTQCYNSTWSTSSMTCNYPSVMQGTKRISPIDTLSVTSPIGKKRKRSRSAGTSRIGYRAPARALRVQDNYTSSEASFTEVTASQDTTILCPGSPALYLCGAGHYCPSPVTSFPCPAGSSCPPSSAFPKECQFFSSCTNALSSSIPSNWAHTAYLLASMVALHVAWSTVVKHSRERHRRRRKAAREHLENEKELIEITKISQSEFDLQNPWSMGNDIGETLIWGSAGKTAVTEPPLITPLSSFFSKQGRTQLDLKFDNLSVISQSDESDIVLNQVSGSCRSGRSIVILGPSSAGKTTLLNCLAGSSSHLKQSGIIYVNGVRDSISFYANLIGFIHQEDALYLDLTVEETLTFYAKMRLPAISTPERCRDVVNDVISVLDLKYIVNSVIGAPQQNGISGGERRRVSIGVELVGDPSLLILDEPTAGLDPAISFAVISALKKLSHKGANVIAVLHQPSQQIFVLFDDAIFLINGGSCVYTGKASGAIRFFTSQGFTCPPEVSPPDFFMRILSGKMKRSNDPLWVRNDLVTLWNGYTKRRKQGAVIVSTSTNSHKSYVCHATCGILVFPSLILGASTHSTTPRPSAIFVGGQYHVSSRSISWSHQHAHPLQ